MRLLLFLSILTCFFSSNSVFAQRVSLEETKKVLSKWQAKSNDSIRIQRKESERLRSEMRVLVKQLGHEPMFIFGPNDAWISEDMNQLFESAPKAFGLNVNRDKRQATLENNHVLLYWADLRLFRWKKIKKTVDSLMVTDSLSYEWTGYDYDETEVKKYSKKELQNIVNQRIAYNLYSQNTRFFPEGNFLVKKKEKEKKAVESNPTSANVENTAELYKSYLGASYPAQGQYNFYLGEDLRNQGYVSFQKDSFMAQMMYLVREDWTFKIVWEDNAKYKKEEGINLKMDWDEPVSFWFTIPSDLQAATFYKLSLIGTKGDESQTKILCENYFRTSKYNLVDKLKKFIAQRPVYDNQKGCFPITIDEPFDQIEVSGRNRKGRKLMDISSDYSSSQEADYLLRSNELTYFLETPKITPIDTNDLSKIPIAEIDHTADALFVKNLNFGQFDGERPAFVESYQDTIVIGSIIFLKKDFIEKDTILGAFFAPKVTQKDFQAGKIKLPTKIFTYNIGLSGLKKQYEVNKLLSKLVEDRINERAAFFYQLAVRDWKRNPSKPRPMLEIFKKEELKNLLPKVKITKVSISNSPYTAIINFLKTDPEERNLLIWEVPILR